jgi:hypothetical protein
MNPENCGEDLGVICVRICVHIGAMWRGFGKLEPLPAAHFRDTMIRVCWEDE